MNEIQHIIPEIESIPLMKRTDILPDCIVAQYETLSERLKYSSEDELRATGKIKLLDERLRVGFWRELEISLRSNRKLMLKRVFTGLCTEQHFYKLITCPERFAWITSPVIPYEARTDALLTLAVSRYEEILNMDITNKKKVIVGKDDEGNPVYDIKDIVDPFRAKLLIETIKMLEDRVKGLSVQRQAITHQHSGPDGNLPSMTMADIDKKLNELSGRLNLEVNYGSDREDEKGTDIIVEDEEGNFIKKI